MRHLINLKFNIDVEHTKIGNSAYKKYYSKLKSTNNSWNYLSRNSGYVAPYVNKITHNGTMYESMKLIDDYIKQQREFITTHKHYYHIS